MYAVGWVLQKAASQPARMQIAIINVLYYV